MKLESFDGREVRQTTLALVGAGDGLSKALSVDPRELRLGERVQVVVEGVVTRIDFEPIHGDGSDLARKHVAKATNATIVDERLVRAVLDEQAERILQARDQESGAQRLDLNGEKPSVEEEHEQGLHLRTRKNCPICQAEKAAKATTPAKKRGLASVK